ncbi:(d)CMP kinase [Clostridium psychrophilum]|uniref:(d)CMP kinase n=1 Tax=Clostridium psychrophilum TaxID=132926 RepID=UPI001C0E0842|nr:cytidylate kinase family protein [Clostridium psychrophilum]MBU3179714.1 cytidylate kinase family protein [Clostridium psychrophilum]
MKITITGELYSGKSCVAKAISEVMNYTYFSVGELQRKLAVEKGMSIMEYNDYMFNNNLDHEVDNKTMEIGRENENFIFDARLAWYFIPDSFKIYLKVETDIAVERAMTSKRGKSENYVSKDEARERITERRRLEVTRFKGIYDVNIDKNSNYDLVIDTSHKTLEEVTEKILGVIRGIAKE